jgi:predicted RNA binding protein YcfA (HicA-like mRNA interferase family)
VTPITGPELCRLVERKIIVIPVHANRELKPGLARRILRDAGIEP